jgi:ribosomal protein L39E
MSRRALLDRRALLARRVKRSSIIPQQVIIKAILI